MKKPDPPKCTHPELAPVVSGTGRMIGYECKACMTAVSGFGACAQCGSLKESRWHLDGYMLCREECFNRFFVRRQQDAMKRRRRFKNQPKLSGIS